MDNAEVVAAVNSRLKKGEGWIGYRYSKDVRSKFLYYAFYRDGKQEFVNTKTNEPEEAYKQLLEARRLVEQGLRLPSEISRIYYEDLRNILLEYYRTEKPASIYTRRTEDGGTEETFAGSDKLDKFFKRCPITKITAIKIQEYVKSCRREGYADGTIRRHLGGLCSAFNRAKALDLITDAHIPSFNLPKDSKPRTGFLDFEDFTTLRDAMPKAIQPTLTFLYFTGCRTGAAKKITWEMISKDCSEIELPRQIMKNDEPLTLPLVGPLEELATMLRGLRKSFPKPTDRVFSFRNWRVTWNRTCAELGLGEWDKATRHYKGLTPHDFRRSAARNLIKAGVDRRTAMKITGHKTESIFERYNIKRTDDVKEALMKVGRFSGVVSISA
jgi:integrase